ncbi:hypothetical protein [Streptomyces alfalfae]
MRRDGARLHAGSTPTGDLDRIRRKTALLVAPGVPERRRWRCRLPAVSPSAALLEGQADADSPASEDLPDGVPVRDHEEAFEAGLALILGGLEQHIAAPDAAR